MSENKKIELLKKGNLKAQKKVYEEYAEKMFLVCYRYVNNEQDAGGIVNNAFYNAFTNIDKFEVRENGGFEGWLKKIVINECLMFIREKRKIEFVEDDQWEIQNVSNNPDHDTDYYILLINSLPAGFRTIFNLYAIEGYSHKEIANKLNISESTSRSQLARAREILQNKVNQSNSSNHERKE